MGFLDRFQKEPSIKGSAFHLTETGREKLQTFTGDTNSQVLLALENGGSLDIEEISRATRIPPGHVEGALRGLLKRGYISTGQGVDF